MESRSRGRKSFLGKFVKATLLTVVALLFFTMSGITTGFALDVQPAIDDGVNWLVTRQGADGGWEPFCNFR